MDFFLIYHGLFFDLSRAFYSLSVEFIIDKCYNIGFRGIFLSWLRSYLISRIILVKVNNSFSQEENINLCVSQGFVLGSLLFLLFINDLPINLKNMLFLLSGYADFSSFLNILRLVLFADDTSVVISAKTFEELQTLCQLLLQCFVEWCRKNNIIINISKTECIHFQNRSDGRNKLTLRFSDYVIEAKQSARFLGIYLDQNLKWCSHVHSVSKKLNSSFYAMSRVRNLIPLQSLMNVYYSLVYSHLSYNIMLWGNSSDVCRVFIAQKRILRMMFNIPPRTSCRPYFKNNNILTVASIFIFRCLLYAKENENHITKLSTFHSYNTRNFRIMSLPKHRTAKFEMSLLYMSMKLFNHLPSGVQSLSLKEFRKTIKDTLYVKCYYTVGEYFSDKL